MLEINGFVKGVQYKNETVAPEKLLELFNMKDVDLSRNHIIFKRDKSRVKDDPENRRKKFARRIMFPPVTSGTFDGNFVTIRYYQSKKKDAKGNDLFKPTRLKQEGMEMKVDLQRQKEEAVFMLFNVGCKDSPLKSPRSPKYYGVSDKHKDAVVQLDKENLLASLIVSINNMPEVVVRRLSHAMKISGTNMLGKKVTLSVKGIGDETITGMRAQLVAMAKELPGEFQVAMNDQDLLMKGMIQEAKDAGILVRESAGRGIVVWKWRHDIEGGADIIRTRPSEDPFHALYKHVLKPEVFEYFTSIVNNELGYEGGESQQVSERLIKAATNVSKPEEMSDAELLDWALSHEEIYFDRSDGKVYLLVNGDKDDTALHVVKEKDWKNDLLAAMEIAKIKRNRFLKHVLKR